MLVGVGANQLVSIKEISIVESCDVPLEDANTGRFNSNVHVSDFAGNEMNINTNSNLHDTPVYITETPADKLVIGL